MEALGKLYGIKCLHHSVGQATSANEDRRVDEAVHTSYLPLVFWMREPFEPKEGRA